MAVVLSQGWSRSDGIEALTVIFENWDGDLPETASQVTIELAIRVLTWLNDAMALAGRHLVLGDALWLIEDLGQGE